MPLQKPVHFFRQLSANAFRGRDLLDACLAQTIHGPELPQQQIFPVLTHARAIVENAFSDSFFHEQLVISVGEPMRLIADALKQSQAQENPLEVATAVRGRVDKSPRVLLPDR